MRVYLAHPMGTYGSDREQQAIELLTKAGHEVINPRERQYSQACGKHMARWVRLAAACEAIALLPFKDGRMGSGMKMELDAAVLAGLPVIQISAAVDGCVTLKTPPGSSVFLSMAATGQRNQDGQKRRHLAQIPFMAKDTVLHPELVATALGHLKKIATPPGVGTAAGASSGVEAGSRRRLSM